MNPDFNTLVSTTLQKYRTTLADNITGNQAIWAQLKSSGFVREEDGGREIVEPLLVGTNTTVRSFKGYDLLDVTPQDGITSAVFQWKHIAGTVSISGDEKFQNSGSRERIINLVDAKIQQLEISMMLEVNRQILGDGTGNSGKDITGLGIGVEDGTAWSTYGGIDSNTYTYWRNGWINFAATAGDFEATSGRTTKGVRILRNLLNSISRGKDRPSLIVTTQAIYESYLATVEERRRFTDGTLADLGFKNVLFDDIPMVWDSDVSAGDAFALNSRYLRFVVGKGRNFHASPFVDPANQDAETSKVIFTGNFTMNNRARQGRVTGITTP